MSTVVLLLLGALGVFLLDRTFRWMEDRGWIYYRRTRPGGGAIGYHMLETSAVFNPSAEIVQEILVEERREEDEAGDPLTRRSGSSKEDPSDAPPEEEP